MHFGLAGKDWLAIVPPGVKSIARHAHVLVVGGKEIRFDRSRWLSARMYNLTGEAIQRNEVSSHVQDLKNLFLYKCKSKNKKSPLYEVDLEYGKELALLFGSSEINAVIERIQKIRQAERTFIIHGPVSSSI